MTVLMVALFGDTNRMRLFRESAMYTLPLESTATPFGWLNLAKFGLPPSPEKPGFPFPAKVLIIRFVDTLRTTLLLLSAI